MSFSLRPPVVAIARVAAFATAPLHPSQGALRAGPAPPPSPPADSLYADLSGAELYQAACANCHGVEGTGAPEWFVAFKQPIPDFTDCNFATREPDADWIAVAHQGGPVRGFSRLMPSFGGVLTPEQLQRVMDHVRTLCASPDWPRGELNLPRAILTEKAFPEDEAVWEVNTPLEHGADAVMNTLVWERRIGARTQMEVLVPFGFRERVASGPDGEAGGTPSDWVGGMGDLTLGLKHVVSSSLEQGRIVSVSGEIKLPTGNESRGFGTGHPVLEGFVSWGQFLPFEAFLQAQALFEAPVSGPAANEAKLRTALGRTFVDGAWGRAWSPMLEFQAVRELQSGGEWALDVVPQVQVTLNTRQHVMLNLGVLVPVTDTDLRRARLHLYLLWDWFDGGFFEGW